VRSRGRLARHARTVSSICLSVRNPNLRAYQSYSKYCSAVQRGRPVGCGGVVFVFLLLASSSPPCYSVRRTRQGCVADPPALTQTLMSLTPGFQCVHPRTLMTNSDPRLSFLTTRYTSPPSSMATATLVVVIKKTCQQRGSGPPAPTSSERDEMREGPGTGSVCVCALRCDCEHCLVLRPSKRTCM
jgi:hypothetical protein